MNIDQLIEKGLLKKDTQDDKKAAQSLKVAKSKLEQAKKSLKADLPEPTIIYAYMTMFHAARAILFKDGYIEKSHFAIVVYLEEKYSQKIGPALINKLNTLRTLRHEGLYGLDSEFSNEEAESAIKDAEEFLEQIKRLI